MLYCLGEPFDKMVKRLATVKTPFVEVVDDGIHALDKRRVSILKQAAKSYGITFTVHSPFADINVASPSKYMLSSALKRLKQSVAFTNDLEARLWVLHPGSLTGISTFYPGKDWEQNCKSISELHEVTEEFGVNMALENLPGKYGFIMKSAADFSRFYRETGLNVGITFDVGHANLENQVFPFLETHADKIVHIHASDNLGESDQHLGIGYGSIDWAGIGQFLKRIEYSQTLITESSDHVQESVQKLKRLFD